MELNQLKNAWNKFSDSEAKKHRIDEAELRRMLKRKANGQMERLDRNVWIGFASVIILVIFFVADDFLITPNLSDGIQVPAWIIAIDIINVTFLLGTFLYFWKQYRNTKRTLSRDKELPLVLRTTIQLLYTYRRLFYGALIVFLLVVIVSALTGFLSNIRSEQVMAEKNQLVVFGSLALLLAIVSVIFLAFHWAFRRLYGRYIKQLECTLAELDEL